MAANGEITSSLFLLAMAFFHGRRSGLQPPNAILGRRLSRHFSLRPGTRATGTRPAPFAAGEAVLATLWRGGGSSLKV